MRDRVPQAIRIKNAVAVACEARSLCFGDVTEEMEQRLNALAKEIIQADGNIGTVALAAELLTWLNGRGTLGGRRITRHRTAA